MLKVGLHELFEQMNYCPGETEVSLKENKEGGFSIALHKKPRSLYPTYIPFHSHRLINLNPVGEENCVTLQIFKRMILPLSDSSVSSEITILSKLEKKILYEKPLKARFIRKCYQTLIGLKLASYKRVAAFSKETDILFFKDNIFGASSQGGLYPKKDVHREAWIALKKELVLEWGKERVKRVTKKYKISFKDNIKKGAPLRKKHIQILLIGLSDYQKSDLDASLKRLINVAKKKLAIESLPSFELKKLKAKYESKNQDLQKTIEELFLSHQNDLFLDLPLELQSFIQDLTFLNGDELECSFLGTRKEGIVNGSQSNLKAQLIYNPSSLDEERLYLYQTIWDASLKIPEERFELFFLELMTKCLSKKELFEGCFIPYPDKKNYLFYYVDMRLANGKSKLGYYLRSVFDSLKDLFIYRGTSLDPSMTDALGSLLSDLYPFKPPGSLWQNASRHEESRIFSSSNKTIVVSGHSLGGCLTMFASLEFFLTQNSGALLNRKFKIRTFDTPKIDEESTEKFASWCQTSQISIKHYINRKDLFPKFGGNSLLGKNAQGIKVSVVLLSPKDSQSPLALKSTHTHLFFKNNNFDSETMTIEDYLKEGSLLEKLRVFGGFFLFPMIFAVFIIKRFFFGWRGSPAICKLLFLKMVQPLAKIQEK